VVGLAKELAESISKFVGTLYSTVSLDGCRSVAEQILDDKASRLRNLEQMLSPSSLERWPAVRMPTGQRVVLSAGERESSPLVSVTTGD
jgi:hypothetical protein